MSHRITHPMLASPCEDTRKLTYPVLATPKLDGIRCLIVNGKAVSRKFKPIPNRFIRTWLENNMPDGLDGELMVRNVPFSKISGHIARHAGEPDFVFMVFDYVNGELSSGYVDRIRDLRGLVLPESRVELVLPIIIASAEELAVFENKCIAEGYEGVMVRSPEGPYKCGRSTEREGYLLKVKQFEDADAEILDTYEGFTNQNEAEKDAFGRTKRSTAMAGIVGRDELGGFWVKDTVTGIEFSVGYNHVRGGIDRKTLWNARNELVGKFIKYKHQKPGAKDKPRFPQFLAFREEWDMS